MKRIYISGPITHADPYRQEDNLRAFHVKSAELRALGRNVTNPAENGLPLDAHWQEHMRADIRDMMDCNAIHMLPGWRKSRGARLELLIALKLGFAVEGVRE